jgi:DNA-binding MarR family transcriptional regulator
VGAHAASRFAERLKELDLVPAHAGILRLISMHGGTSQQALASLLGMVPSRLVALIDELERRHLVERRDDPDDRRVYALYLTDKGTKTMTDIGRVAKAHDDTVCAALDEEERTQLSLLLRRIAEEQQLTAGVHPGFARIGETTQEPSDTRPRRE